MERLIRHPDAHITLPIQYFGSVGYFALMSAYPHVNIPLDRRFDKRFKSAHRMTVADTHGVIQLTVPVSKPEHHTGAPLTWDDIAISRHGNWWNVHRETLASAYGRTPFFEYYIDRLIPFFNSETPDCFSSVARLDAAITLAVARILGLDTEITFVPAPTSSPLGAAPALSENPSSTLGANSGFFPTLSEKFEPVYLSPREAKEYITGQNYQHPSPYPNLEIENRELSTPYYQVRADKFGFLPHMSILDLIFNLGPESPLHLARLTS